MGIKLSFTSGSLSGKIEEQLYPEHNTGVYTILDYIASKLLGSV